MSSQFSVLVGDHEGDQSQLRDYADSISGRTSLSLPRTDHLEVPYQSGSQTARADRHVGFTYQQETVERLEPVRGHVRSRSNMAFDQNVPTPRFSIQAAEVNEYDEQVNSQRDNAQAINPPHLSKKAITVSVLAIVLLFLISQMTLIDWSTKMSIDGHGELTVNSHFYSPFCTKEVHSLTGPTRSGSSTFHSINRFIVQSAHTTCLSTMIVLDTAPRAVLFVRAMSLLAMIVLLVRDQLIKPTMKRKAILGWIGQTLLTGPFTVQRYRSIVSNNKDNKQS